MTKRGLPSLDEKLDEALKETFPASDAFALLPDPVPRPQTVAQKTDVRPKIPEAGRSRVGIESNR